jgi:hypothetical protein
MPPPPSHGRFMEGSPRLPSLQGVDQRQAELGLKRHLRWQGAQLFLGGLWIGEIMQWQAEPYSGQWRAWVMTDPAGAHHGWFASEDDARRQVETIAVAAIVLPPSPLR